MASENTGVQAPSAGDEGFALVGKGGKPISPKSAQAGGSAAPAPAYADVVAGLASSTPAHAIVAAPTPASGKRAVAKPRSKSPSRPAADNDMHAELLAAIAHAAGGAREQRVDAELERRQRVRR